MGLSCNIVLFSSEHFLAVVGLDSRSRHRADDGFVSVSLKPDRGTNFLFCMSVLQLVEHLFLTVTTYLLAFGF